MQFEVHHGLDLLVVGFIAFAAYNPPDILHLRSSNLRFLRRKDYITVSCHVGDEVEVTDMLLKSSTVNEYVVDVCDDASPEESSESGVYTLLPCRGSAMEPHGHPLPSVLPPRATEGRIIPNPLSFCLVIRIPQADLPKRRLYVKGGEIGHPREFFNRLINTGEGIPFGLSPFIKDSKVLCNTIRPIFFLDHDPEPLPLRLRGLYNVVLKHLVHFFFEK